MRFIVHTKLYISEGNMESRRVRPICKWRNILGAKKAKLILSFFMLKLLMPLKTWCKYVNFKQKQVEHLSEDF